LLHCGGKISCKKCNQIITDPKITGNRGFIEPGPGVCLY